MIDIKLTHPGKGSPNFTRNLKDLIVDDCYNEMWANAITAQNILNARVKIMKSQYFHQINIISTKLEIFYKIEQLERKKNHVTY